MVQIFPLLIGTFRRKIIRVHFISGWPSTRTYYKNVSRIAVSIDCEPDADHVTNNVFFVKCARKDFVGYTHIDTLTMNRYGGAGVFSNLSSSNKYFLRFDKAEDGIYLSGTFTISD